MEQTIGISRTRRWDRETSGTSGIRRWDREISGTNGTRRWDIETSGTRRQAVSVELGGETSGTRR